MRIQAELEKIKYVLASRDLLDFTKITKPDYQADPFHRTLATILEKFYEDVAAKKSPRYIIIAPPQHGKSELVSRRFPAWALGKQPEWCFIGCSYNQDWANDLCRNVQQIMEEESYQKIFTTRIPVKGNKGKASTVRNQDYFEIIGHQGRYKAVGRGGGATGRPAHILIIDDPLKDYQEAMSDVIRDASWEHYRSSLRTRVQQGGGILLILTRWHDDDMAGRMLEQARKSDSQHKDNWIVFRFPAIAEAPGAITDAALKNPFDNRNEGQALSDGRFNRESLLTLQNTLSPVQWNALYQGTPIPLAGNIFDATKWQYYTTLPDWRDFSMIVGSWDCAFKDTTSADFVAAQVWGISGQRRFLLDYRKEQMSYTQTKAAMREQKARWGKLLSFILVEDKANGTAVMDDLKNDISGMLAIEPEGGKIARAWKASSDQASGNCYLPEPGAKIKMTFPDSMTRDGVSVPGATYEYTADYVTDFTTTARKFPVVAHDDDIDAFTQLICWAQSFSFGVIDYLKSEQARIDKEQKAKRQEQAQRQQGDDVNKVTGSGELAKPATNDQTEACPKCGSHLVVKRGGQKHCNGCGNDWQPDPKKLMKPTRQNRAELAKKR